jgi:cytochrome c
MSHAGRWIALSSLLLMIIVLSSSTSASVSAAAAGDADRGRVLYEKRCTGCHSLDHNLEGPRLRTVYGRKAGSVTGFSYSAALKSAQIIWDDVSLDRWLTDPDSLAPGNDMSFHIPKSSERADVIRFLKVTSEKQKNPE